MERKKLDIHTFVLRLATVLTVLVLVTTSMVTGRFARYTSGDSAKDSARVAGYVLDIHDTQAHYLNLTGIQKPGDSETYRFTVRNHNGTFTSEVDEEFFLSLELRGSLPLVCSLSGEDVINLNAESIAENGLVAGSGSVHTFAAAVQSGKSYTLTVTWPSEENDIQYSRAGIAQLVLSVAAQQVD